MVNASPRLYADDRGVWREDRPGQPFGIEWGEIAGVGGYRLDGVTEVYTVVELDFDSGEWLELHADWPGFSAVTHAIAARLPSIPEGWFAEIERRQPGDAPITVWRRAEPGATTDQPHD
jgi:hypothetical protein